MNTDGILAIAHRGASAYAPENTFAAFDLALRMGAQHIELDVHATADGQAAVIHDETLDRTTNGTGPVAERTMAELGRLDAGSWFGAPFAGERAPAFSETLARYARQAHLHAEIKSDRPGFAEHVADLIRRHGAERQTTVMSFGRATLEAVRRYAPELRLGWLVHEPTDSVVATALNAGFGLLCPQASHVTAAQVQRLREQGFVVWAWDVRSEADMRKAVETGVDGMFIDFPDKLLQYLKERSA